MQWKVRKTIVCPTFFLLKATTTKPKKGKIDRKKEKTQKIKETFLLLLLNVLRPFHTCRLPFICLEHIDIQYACSANERARMKTNTAQQNRQTHSAATPMEIKENQTRTTHTIRVYWIGRVQIIFFAALQLLLLLLLRVVCFIYSVTYWKL